MTLGELTSFIEEPANRAHVQKLPSASHGLLSEDLLVEAFLAFDVDGSGALDQKEWYMFLHALEVLRLQHLLCEALQAFRAFFGRDQRWWPSMGIDRRHLTARDLRRAAGSTLHVGQGIPPASDELERLLAVEANPSAGPRRGRTRLLVPARLVVRPAVLLGEQPPSSWHLCLRPQPPPDAGRAGSHGRCHVRLCDARVHPEDRLG